MSRYDYTPIIRDEEDKRFYATTIYPDILPTNEDIYIITTIGDRLDLLAFDFYGDSTLWWIIASANDMQPDSLVPPLGMTLRIPVNVPDIINNVRLFNDNR
jgi:hypothetical protein